MKKILLIIGLTIFSNNALCLDLTLEGFITRLKTQYHFATKVDKYSLTYTEKVPVVSQSYDFENPSVIIAKRTIEIDSNSQYFFEESQTFWPGGFIFHDRSFKSKEKNLTFDVNGIRHGKTPRKLNSDSFNKRVNTITNLVDAFAVNKLLSPHNIKGIQQVNIDNKSNQASLIHFSKKHLQTVYTFNLVPLRLLSISAKESGSHIGFSNYVVSNGLEFAANVTHFQSDGSKTELSIHALKEINEIEKGNFILPAEYKSFIDKGEKLLTTTNIAKDIYLVSNESANRNMLFKVIGSNIMVFGAPLNSQLSEETIALIKKQFPTKKIKSVYVTHPHGDHIGGLKAYADEGVSIIADQYTIHAIKNHPPFANFIGSFRFEAIEHNQLINGVRFHILENSHVKGQSFAHFEEQALIYQGDFLEVPFDNTIAKNLPDVSITFIEYIQEFDLRTKRIVGHHRNNNISIQRMNEYYYYNIKDF